MIKLINAFYIKLINAFYNNFYYLLASVIISIVFGGLGIFIIFGDPFQYLFTTDFNDVCHDYDAPSECLAIINDIKTRSIVVVILIFAIGPIFFLVSRWAWNIEW